MAQELFLKQWFKEQDLLLDDSVWLSHPLISNQTAENEVRYREGDHRAIKKTWPGTFGNTPRQNDVSAWIPQPATPTEYLHRLALQNELFDDSIHVEGAIISCGPSMIIGQPADGLSIVTSQPWLDAKDEKSPHPSELEIDIFMKDLGFTSLISSLYGWQNSDSTLIILDAKPDNIDLLMTELPSSN